jgi:hypothetical protein
VSVVDKDLGLREIKRNLKEYKKTIIKVGIQSNAGFNKNTSIIKYATANEFGTDIIPERSFIRSTADEKKEEWYSFIDKGLTEVTEGKKKPLQVLGLLGIKARDDIKEKIGSNIKPENAESTKLKKAGSKTAVTTTLIDTGVMRNSVNYTFSY